MKLPWEISLPEPKVLDWWAICMHVHCRDEEQRQKTTIVEVLRLALLQGVGMIIDMPNPERPVIDRYRVWERLSLAPPNEKDRYRLYVGLTGDPAQILEALWCYANIPEVFGLKMFAGKSVGNLSVIDKFVQRMVYQILAEQNYRGVLALHCEKEELMNAKIWDPSNPITHCWARPEVAEVGSVVDQIGFALGTGYKGRMHICHVSSPSSVVLVQEAKAMGLRITCGITPHHLMFDESKMFGADGLMYKMNPPLRSSRSVLRLWEQLLAGMIDVIETDHAVHTPEEKGEPRCLSGYPSMELYSQFTTECLPSYGLTLDIIKALTRDNILKIFSDKF